MKESRLARQIRVAVEAQWPRAFVVALHDPYHPGAPDLLIQLPGLTVYVETQAPAANLSQIQRVSHSQIEYAGGQVIVAATAEDVLDYLRRGT